MILFANLTCLWISNPNLGELLSTILSYVCPTGSGLGDEPLTPPWHTQQQANTIHMAQKHEVF
jgi:hypothetical protein